MATQMVNYVAVDGEMDMLSSIRRTRQEVGVLREEVAVMDRKLRAHRANIIARRQNCLIKSDDSILSVFRDVCSNEAIRHFPLTQRDVMKLTSAELDGILKSLGLDCGGKLEAKLDRFKRHSGLQGMSIPI